MAQAYCIAPIRRLAHGPAFTRHVLASQGWTRLPETRERELPSRTNVCTRRKRTRGTKTHSGHRDAERALWSIDSESASLRLDVEGPDDVAPLLGFVGNEFSERGRCH